MDSKHASDSTAKSAVPDESQSDKMSDDGTPDTELDTRLRTPKRKLELQRARRKGKRRKHDDDQFRRGVFAGLAQADKKHERTALMLAEDANKIFSLNGMPELKPRTAQQWRADFERDKNGRAALLTFKVLKPGEWPAYSPDLNLIENLMAHAKTEVQVRFADEKILEPTEAQWRQYLEEEWHKIPAWQLHKYYDSMPRRCRKCIERHGRPLDY
jgi:hypothetical protein